MKVTNEKTEERQVYLTIEMEPAEVEEGMQKAYRRLVQRVEVPGFRRGKAPRPLLERQIGKKRLLDEAIDELVPDAYAKAIKEQNIEPFARPYVEVVTTEPVAFKAVVPLAPVVEAGDYLGIRVKGELVSVTDEDVDAVLEQLRHRQASWEPADQPVEPGNLVTVDIESQIDGQGYLNRPGLQYQAVPGLRFPAPGFPEQLIGMKKDEVKEFKLSLPADHPRTDWAGKEVSFKVKLAETKLEKMPELNDEFAQTINPEFKTLPALRERIMTDLRQSAEERAKADFQDKAVQAAVDVTRLEFPPILVENEEGRILDERLQHGSQRLEDYLRAVGKTQEQLHEEIHTQAERRIKRSLVLGKIAELEKVEVTDAEIAVEIEEVVKTASEDKKEEMQRIFSTDSSKQSLKQIVLTRKTVERLVEIARGPAEAKAGETEVK